MQGALANEQGLIKEDLIFYIVLYLMSNFEPENMSHLLDINVQQQKKTETRKWLKAQ